MQQQWGNIVGLQATPSSFTRYLDSQENDFFLGWIPPEAAAIASLEAGQTHYEVKGRRIAENWSQRVPACVGYIGDEILPRSTQLYEGIIKPLDGSILHNQYFIQSIRLGPFFSPKVVCSPILYVTLFTDLMNGQFFLSILGMGIPTEFCALKLMLFEGTEQVHSGKLRWRPKKIVWRSCFCPNHHFLHVILFRVKALVVGKKQSGLY